MVTQAARNGLLDRIPPTGRLTVNKLPASRVTRRDSSTARPTSSGSSTAFAGTSPAASTSTPSDDKTLFQPYAEQWRAGQLHRPSTAAQTETYLRVHAYPFLGHRALAAVRRSEIQAWVKNRSGRASVVPVDEDQPPVRSLEDVPRAEVTVADHRAVAG